jgi:hypothetical protein
MAEQETFFSPSHNRLLNIAVWAKYLAWLVLAFYSLNVVLQIVLHQYFFSDSPVPLRARLMDEVGFFATMATTLLRGVVAYLVLKGLSLGLNMIVETDINYREREEGAQ